MSFRRPPSSKPSSEPASILDSDRSKQLITARIRGLESVDECQEWMTYEVEESPAGDPRKWVIAALNQRVTKIQSCSPE